jgi:hypothetical protein
MKPGRGQVDPPQVGFQMKQAMVGKQRINQGAGPLQVAYTWPNGSGLPRPK